MSIKMAVGVVDNILSVVTVGLTMNNNRFDDLVLVLKEALGPSSGLASDDVDVGHLTNLMEEYDSKEIEWRRFAMGDDSRGYTRNLVDEGNGKSNLVRQHGTWP